MMHVSECIFHIDHFIIIARDFYNISVSDDWNVTQHLSHEKKLGFMLVDYGITGCGVFKAGIQNWKGFCIKINCSQIKLLNFENWTNGQPQ